MIKITVNTKLDRYEKLFNSDKKKVLTEITDHSTEAMKTYIENQEGSDIWPPLSAFTIEKKMVEGADMRTLIEWRDMVDSFKKGYIENENIGKAGIFDNPDMAERMKAHEYGIYGGGPTLPARPVLRPVSELTLQEVEDIAFDNLKKMLEKLKV